MAGVVFKFGGAALADGAGVERTCEIVGEFGGERPVVVVSAHAGVTALLESVARSAALGVVEAEKVRIRHRTLLHQLDLESELLDRYLVELAALLAQVRARGRLQPGELDYIRSYGERMSARVVAQALRRAGQVAHPVDAFDLGLVTDSNHGRARPLAGSQAAIRAALKEVEGIAVVTGFLAKDECGNLTTLGKNGSDLTASLIAEAVGAERLCFWKSVDGILTADPRLVPDARIIERLSYRAASEFAFHGAEVLHPAAVEPALRARVPVEIRNVHDPGRSGTALVAEECDTGPIGIASRCGMSELRIALPGPETRGAVLAELFAAFHEASVEPRSVSIGADFIRLVVPPDVELERGLAERLPVQLDGELEKVQLERELGVCAVIGHGVGSDHRLGMRALELLDRANIEVREAFLGSRLESQAFLLSQNSLPEAVAVLHAHLVAGI